MRREPLKYIGATLLIVIAVIEISLLLSGYRILLGEKYVPEMNGALGFYYPPDHAAYYECTYFTGRKKVVEELFATDYDECPFIWTHG